MGDVLKKILNIGAGGAAGAVKPPTYGRKKIGEKYIPAKRKKSVKGEKYTPAQHKK